MRCSTKGFIHGMAYSTAAAAICVSLLPEDAHYTAVWFAFMVLDIASCLTYAGWAMRPTDPVGSVKND